LVHRIRRQYDRIRVRAETDFRRGRDHDLIPHTRREVGQEQSGCTGTDRYVTQHVPTGTALYDYLVTGDDAVVRVVRRRIPLQVHRTGVVRSRFDVLGCSRRA